MFTILFFVNTRNGAMQRRAEDFGRFLGAPFAPRILVKEDYAKSAFMRMIRIFYDILCEKPHFVYALDVGFSASALAVLLKLFRRSYFIVDTGDAYYELMKDSGKVGPVRLLFCRIIEQMAYFLADAIVVRGSYHVDYLRSQGYNNVEFLPDSFDPTQCKPGNSEALKRDLGIDDFFSVGMLGSTIWNEKYKIAYGWELPETLHLLKDLPVKGILIGNGDGLERLKRRAAELGIENRMIFTGRIAYEKLPDYLNAVDVWISTQSNDIVGNVRTTGKLPLYMACGRYTLSSATGEAARILPEEMLIPITGVKDASYPGRLAARIRELFRERARLQKGAELREAAVRNFDVRRTAARLSKILLRLMEYRASLDALKERKE
jgi:glycosyltransferase involved in cell wall biosynthesis